MISRFSIKEITFKRIFNGIKRRVFIIPTRIKWSYSKKASINKNKLKSFYNIHKGQTCYLIANGPSLNKIDWSLLEGKITFGMNRIYLLFDKMGFEPNYYVCINKSVLEQFKDEIGNLKMPKFLNWDSNGFFKNNNNIYYVFYSFFRGVFGKDISKSLTPATTVTYAALQIIYYMGFYKVIIIGMDHNFTFIGQINETQKVIEKEDKNHFHPNYFPKGSKWVTPDLNSSEYLYKIARKIYEANGRKIVDCTINGKCNIFEKGKIEDYI
ncbi:MAG: DUF115 domain-containing protein [Desulfobacterales bacterium]|nr:DUF115 domain-containing protein [Desulfobacterales bacterium]